MSFLGLVLGSIPHWLQFIEERGGIKVLDPRKFPSLYEWTQKFAETPLQLKERMPKKDDLINYFRTSQISA
ncbi:hypothetical protein Patl1_19289 [Pistacia atlantica]|uniref:Uncharacterized protein n=1 Tax=Pistacia atlantica TaxID=434234 RepID=A0ACC1C266_9ROSI|nr:hypothetical protein Patl1_19289 [Pistacia atlantica]